MSCRVLVLLVVLLVCACGRSFFPAEKNSEQYRITANMPLDSTMYYLLQPYRDSIDKEMNKVIGYVEKPLLKDQPESLLGNFLADALLKQCSQYYGQPVDVLILNYGSIRVAALPAGAITKRKIYELMPFDNELVVLLLDGYTLLQVLHHIAEEGGWPVAGVRFEIHAGKANRIFVQGKAWDPHSIYKVALSDYLAHGGDNLKVLEGKQPVKLNKLVREAIIEYIEEQTMQRRTLSADKDGRLIIAYE